MNSKQFLEQSIVISRDIQAHLEELERLDALSTATGAIRYDNDRVTGSAPQSARFENIVVRLADIQREVKREVWDLLDAHREIRDVIAQVKDDDVRSVLRMKFLAIKSVSEIAAAFRISKPTVFKRLDAGYEAVAEITGYPAPPRQRPTNKHETARHMMKEVYGNEMH